MLGQVTDKVPSLSLLWPNAEYIITKACSKNSDRKKKKTITKRKKETSPSRLSKSNEIHNIW